MIMQGITVIPASGQNKKRETQITTRIVVVQEISLVSKIHFAANIMTSGSSEIEVIKPSVPYFKDQRYQTNPVQSESVAATAAVVLDFVKYLAAIKTDPGSRRKIIQAVMML